MSETWMPVVGFSGYEVSSLGSVRSIPRETVTRSGVVKRLSGKVLSPWVCSSGYHEIYLGRGNAKLVHLLVIEAFKGSRPSEDFQCMHLDGDQLNNAAENLDWGTRSQNNLDKQAHGTDHQRNKTHCPRDHELVEPNLVPGRWKKGYRTCYACALESWSTQGRIHFDRERANQRYRNLIGVEDG